MRFVVGLAIALAVATGAGGCGGTEDVMESGSPAGITPTGTSSTAPSPTQTPELNTHTSPVASPIPTVPPDVDPFDPDTWTVVPVPTGTVPPAPESWDTFTGKGVIPYHFRYPNTWFVGGPSRVLSFDPATWTTSRYPPGGEVFEVSVGPAESAAERPDQATDIVVSGLPAWEIVRVFDLAGADGGISRYHSIGLDVSGYRVFLVGFFEEKDANETEFRQIVASFMLVDAP